MNLLSISGISKKVNTDFALQDIHFNQQAFQKIAIAGETGSGKTTLLKMIAGLVQPDAGIILFEGERVKGPDEVLVPGHPRIAYLSQHFELRTNYRVEEVLEYANKLTVKEADRLYQVCRIDHLLKRRTDQLSGGEKQRIALARLLTTSPRLLLLDEPFSNLDLIHKNILKSVIRDIGEKLNISCIMVSHDPLDTLSWADKMLVMKDGRIIQQGTPKEIYSKPVNEYAAALSGKYQLFSADQANALTGKPEPEMGEKKLLVRPEQFFITKKPGAAMKGKITHVAFLGTSYELQVLSADKEITILTTIPDFVSGDIVYLSVSSSDRHYV